MDEDMEFNQPDAENFDDGLDVDDSAAYMPQKVGEEKDITKDGGVKKLLVKEGEGWDKPETGDNVTVHYTGTLLDGTKFDSSVDRGDPFRFKLGQGQVIKGWDKGVATMRKGEKAAFTIAPDYGYGPKGSPPTIPPNATLKFDVELLEWTSVKDICGDGGLFKTVLEEGKKWEMPKDPDEVRVIYEAKLEDGTVVGKSPEEGVDFYVKQGHFCPGLARAVKTMYKAQKVLLSVKPQYGFGEAGREAVEGFPAIPPNATLQISLELPSWKSVENVTLDGKVTKKCLREGEGYEKPNEGAFVKVRFTGRLVDGTEFERQGGEAEEPFQFRVDEEQVVSGLDQAVTKMKKGELGLVTVPPEFGYKDQEHKADLATVPPNSTLLYEVELVEFEKEKESWEMEPEEKVTSAGKRKEEGNELFKAGKYERASKKYAKGTRLIEYDSQFSDDLKKQAKVLNVSCNLNNAAAQLKLKEYMEAIKLCNKVLEAESQNVKALFRRAQAYIANADYDLASWDIKKALEVDPTNKELKAEQRLLRQKVADQNKKEAKLYSNMFARMNKVEAKETGGTGGGVAQDTEPQPAEPASEPVAVDA